MCLHQVLKRVTAPGADSSVHRHWQGWGLLFPGKPPPWAHFRGVHRTLPAPSRNLSFSHQPLGLLLEKNKQVLPTGPTR